MFPWEPPVCGAGGEGSTPSGLLGASPPHPSLFRRWDPLIPPPALGIQNPVPFPGLPNIKVTLQANLNTAQHFFHPPRGLVINPPSNSGQGFYGPGPRSLGTSSAPTGASLGLDGAGALPRPIPTGRWAARAYF